MYARHTALLKHHPSFPPLHLADTAQRRIPAKRTKVLHHPDCPIQRIRQQRQHRDIVDWAGKVREGEEARHEKLEQYQGPYEPAEGDEPCFAVGFVGLKVDYKLVCVNPHSGRQAECCGAEGEEAVGDQLR